MNVLIVRNELLIKVKHWLGIQCHANDTYTMMGWIKRCCKGAFKKKIFYATIACTIYSTWKVRDIALWEKTVVHMQKVLQEIKYIVKHRSTLLIRKNMSRIDRKWFDSL